MTSKLTQELAAAKLSESGLTLADAKELGLTFHDDISGLYRKEDQAPFRTGPGIKIPYFGLTGTPLEVQPAWGPFWRVRRLPVPPSEKSGFDQQTTGGLALDSKGKKKADHKYDQPPNTGTTAYFPRNIDWPDIALDTERSIVLTEGEFKAAKACKEGIPTIGLGGVWNYKSKELAVLFLPVLEEIDWVKRVVYIVYDSDVKENEHVAKSVNQLADMLHMRGAIPYCVFLPELEDLPKTGLDDYIVSMGADSLRAICLSQMEHLTSAKAAWDWNDNFYHITLDPHCVVNRKTGLMYKKEEYISAYSAKEHLKRSVSKTGDINIEYVSLAKEIFEWPLHARLDKLVYNPTLPPLQKVEGESTFNCWTGWGVEEKEGDVGPYMELLDHLFGNDSQQAKWLLTWFAYQIQHPGVKLKTAVLVTGAHGSGKSMLGEILEPIFGHNYSEVDGENFFSQFNEWAAKKQFVLANEVFVKGDKDRRQHASALKNFVTRKKVTINEKYGLKYDLIDRTNIYMTANPLDSLPVDNGERRYFIYTSKASRLDPKFLARWDKWKEAGGVQHLFYYLRHKVDTSWFDPTAPALETESFKAVIEYAQTDRDYLVQDIMENGIKVGDVLLNSDLMTLEEILAASGDSGLKAFGGVTGLRRALTDAGALKLKDPSTPDGRVKVGGRYYTYWALRNQASWAKASADEIKVYLKTKDTGVKTKKF